MTGEKPPRELDAIADVVLAYHPKAKSEPAKKRDKKTRKLAKKLAVAASNDPKPMSREKKRES